MIKKINLKLGWYQGIGRNANVALWTGTTFLTIGSKFNKDVIKDEGLYEEGYCFMPLKFIDNWGISFLPKDIIRGIHKQNKLKKKYDYK